MYTVLFIIVNFVDNDYNRGPYNVTFPAGEIRMFFDVTINDDNIMEENENFLLYISMLPNGIMFGNPSTTTITIIRNDGKLKC